MTLEEAELLLQQQQQQGLTRQTKRQPQASRQQEAANQTEPRSEDTAAAASQCSFTGQQLTHQAGRQGAACGEQGPHDASGRYK